MGTQSASTVQRAWDILELRNPKNHVQRVLGLFMITLIFLNVSAVALGTVKSIDKAYGPQFDAFEVFSVIVFTIEYLARMAFCVADSRYASPIGGRLRFMLRPMSLVDLASILPFYLPFVGIDLRALRALRLLRLFRVFKVARYYSALTLITKVFTEKIEELLLVFMLMILVLIGSSTAIYYCENDAQPEVFSSIPVCMEWAIATLATVGSDMKPITEPGKICACISAILGIGMFALPTGLIGAGFIEELRNRRNKEQKRRCPHCDKEID